MLAEDEISIRVGKEIVFLRPTLRAALRLHRQFGGYAKIIEAILDGNVTTIASVIREGETRHSSLPDLIEELCDGPLVASIEEMQTPLVRFVLQLSDTGETEESDTNAKAEPMTFGDYHKRLYRIATGWLGWTPETAWDATASEIVEAFKGRTELLKSIFGSGDAEEITDEQSPEIFNSKLSAVLAMATARFAAEDAA